MTWRFHISDPEGWLAAIGATAATGLALANYAVSKRVAWQLTHAGRTVHAINSGQGAARSVRVEVSKSATRLSWPIDETYDRVDPGALVAVGTFASSSSYLTGGTVTISWGRIRRRSWTTQIFVE